MGIFYYLIISIINETMANPIKLPPTITLKIIRYFASFLFSSNIIILLFLSNSYLGVSYPSSAAALTAHKTLDKLFGSRIPCSFTFWAFNFHKLCYAFFSNLVFDMLVYTKITRFKI